jgi:hypothetical protein
MAEDRMAVPHGPETIPPLDPLARPSWLQTSWTDADPLRRALTAQANACSAVPLRSRSGESYDLYHDLVVRHVPTARIALRWRGPAGWEELSYRDLHTRSTDLAEQWNVAGLAPGTQVCLLFPMGPELLVAVVTALRLALPFSILPPSPAPWLARRLEKLPDARIVTAPAHEPLLRAYAERLVPVPATPRARRGPPGSMAARPGDPVAFLFSPRHDPPHEPLALSAETAWHAALHDGVVAFGLSPGDSHAAPGFPLLHLQPAVLFATLFGGACFVHLHAADVVADPLVLTRLPLRTLGVCREVRDALGPAGTPPVRTWKHWWKDPSESQDLAAWHRFSDPTIERGVGGNLLVDPARGGALLISPARAGGAGLDVLPAPGRAWSLGPPPPPGRPMLARSGVLHLADSATGLLLVRSEQGYLFAGTVAPGRAGRVFPKADAVSAAERLDFVQAAVIVRLATGDPAEFALLVFTDPRAPPMADDERARRSALIRARILADAGPDALPDDIALLPLEPWRARDGSVDEARCRAEHVSGLLSRMAADRAFQLLSALRALHKPTGCARGP